MQTWQRSLTTSLKELSQQFSTSLRPTPQRCVQLLRSDKACNFENKEVRIHGFVRSVRKQKRFAFAEISDGSTSQSLQAILTPDQATELTTGAAIEISGVWKTCPPGKEQSHELQTTEVVILGACNPETYPIQKKYHSPEFLRQIPHLRLRTPFNSLLSRFRSECLFQLGNVFQTYPGGSFIQVQPPLITSSDCEGAGETFTVLPRESLEPNPSAGHFFRTPKYLTVSSQLHLEAYAAELGNVWALSPTFRAERSDTPRHLSEFYMLEVEVNFMQELDSLTELVEYLIRDLTRRLSETPVGQAVLSAKRTGESGQDFVNSSSHLHQRWMSLMEGPKWPRITYSRAIKLLEDAVTNRSASFSFPPSWSGGLQLEHEKYIVEIIYGGSPVFVTDYPKEVKPFYMACSQAPRDNDSASTAKLTAACFDLLMPEISEVAGGSLREHRLPNLIQNMRDHGLVKTLSKPAGESQHSPSPLEGFLRDTPYPFLQPDEDLGHLRWYADLRRWGTAPHGGFGLGFDRFLGYLTGIGSIRDVVPFPRYFGRADC